MLWIVPSITALLIKFFLLLKPAIRKQRYLLSFLISITFLNIFELLTLFRMGYDLLVLKLYYCAACFAAVYLFIICSQITSSFRYVKHEISLLSAVLMSAVVVFSDKIITGFTLLPNHSITRVAGEFYFAFQIYALVLLALSLRILIMNTSKQTEVIARKRSTIVFLALSPTIITALIVMLLMELGVSINMVGVLSVTLCFMLLIFRGNYDEHDVFRTMKYIPYSSERVFYLKLKSLSKKLYFPASGESVNMKEILKEVEELVVKNANQYFDTQKEVAKALNISESSLSRKLPKK
ncbi:histidine kinase N-terminal 7TM domain-containing protein [Marinomonas mediterranea]|uniref:Uncharacterized protein n=1 Tax=Marinomonas mediterranea (strain ATCC 700492 / JCM 21426 / NBRC 103028 / MMB-1) TaxID=717774 RepID=F2JW98_MARM1|nr:histidine kinase N-terminal 7TM domain-containing protein [Marinomonas mediterranea]ADZ89486.1 hypothetical protein Marme_0182 [Marinomonas mediterranea MMB-1]WCN15735.1 hypothetical protein GV053_00900 [Marinomonas mediterranea MMB-1]